MGAWTHGRWLVKAGREQEFIAALRELQTSGDAEAAAAPITLRDRAQPNLFLTFRRWESAEAWARFREVALPQIDAMRELLDDFELFTLDEIS